MSQKSQKFFWITPLTKITPSLLHFLGALHTQIGQSLILDGNKGRVRENIGSFCISSTYLEPHYVYYSFFAVFETNSTMLHLCQQP